MKIRYLDTRSAYCFRNTIGMQSDPGFFLSSKLRSRLTKFSRVTTMSSKTGVLVTMFPLCDEPSLTVKTEQNTGRSLHFQRSTYNVL